MGGSRDGLWFENAEHAAPCRPCTADAARSACVSPSRAVPEGRGQVAAHNVRERAVIYIVELHIHVHLTRATSHARQRESDPYTHSSQLGDAVDTWVDIHGGHSVTGRRVAVRS